jgi:hypothetical protein
VKLDLGIVSEAAIARLAGDLGEDADIDQTFDELVGRGKRRVSGDRAVESTALEMRKRRYAWSHHVPSSERFCGKIRGRRGRHPAQYHPVISRPVAIPVAILSLPELDPAST